MIEGGRVGCNGGEHAGCCCLNASVCTSGPGFNTGALPKIDAEVSQYRHRATGTPASHPCAVKCAKKRVCDKGTRGNTPTLVEVYCQVRQVWMHVTRFPRHSLVLAAVAARSLADSAPPGARIKRRS